MYSLGAIATVLLGSILQTPTHAFVGLPPQAGSRCATASTQRRATTSLNYAPKNVQEVWDNHFAAFGGKDVSEPQHGARAKFMGLTCVQIGRLTDHDTDDATAVGA